MRYICKVYIILEQETAQLKKHRVGDGGSKGERKRGEEGWREKNTIQNPLPTWLVLYQIAQSDF